MTKDSAVEPTDLPRLTDVRDRLLSSTRLFSLFKGAPVTFKIYPMEHSGVWDNVRLHHAADLANQCVMTDTGDLTPSQAAQAMKDIIVACLQANGQKNRNE